MTAPVRVKAMEAYTRDVGRSIARLDPKSIEELGFSDGGFLEVRGTSTTAAKCLPLYPSDWKQGIVRVDALLRHNAGVSAGDELEVRKASVSPARSVLLTPIGEVPEVTNFLAKHWQEAVKPVESKFASEVLSGTPVVSGDLVIVDYHLERLCFLILEKEPASGVSVISRETKIDAVPWLTTAT